MSDGALAVDHRRSSERHRARRSFLVAFVVFFGGGAIWSAATPLLAGPDEPTHIVKAAAVADGEWTGIFVTCTTKAAKTSCVPAPHSALGLVVVPAFYALIRWPDTAQPAHSQICFHAHPTVPASCARSLNTPATQAEVLAGATRYAWIYDARYPPLYYAIVGLASHVGGTTIDVYLMRLISAALSALFLALALMCCVAYSRNRYLLLGLLVALTPMVWFLAGVVNPSGLEISAAVVVWTSGAILVTERLARPPAGLLVVLGGSAAVLELVRSLSPLWLALTAAFLLAVADRAALTRLLRRWSVYLGLAGVAAIGALGVSWTIVEQATIVYSRVALAPGTPATTILETSFQHTVYYLADMIGVFGWFDTDAPFATYVFWYGLIGAVVLGAIVLAGRRRAAVVVALGVAIVVVPVLISSSQALHNGYVWSGRDTLPLAVGLPILATALAGTNPRLRLPGSYAARVVLPAAAVAAIVQFVAFFEALRRYAVGTSGPNFGFLRHPDWQPAIGILPALVLEVLALVAIYGLLWIAARRTDDAPDAPTTEHASSTERATTVDQRA